MICGEFSPYYLFYPGSAEIFKNEFPNTKLVVLLRDPVDRAISPINYLVAGRSDIWHLNTDPAKQYVFELFDALPHAIYCSKYFFPLKTLFEHVPCEQVLVLQYERCVCAPIEELRRTFQFLGVDDFIPNRIQASVNKNHHRMQYLNEGMLRQVLPAFLKQETLEVLSMKELGLDPELWNSCHE